MKHVILVSIHAVLLWVCSANSVCGDDWPMWRHDAGRSAASSEELPERLSLLWSRAFSARQPAWDDDLLNRDLMPFDRLFEPVIADGRVFIAFNDSDKVVALDAGSGKLLWNQFASGPVRLPPVVWKGRVYFGSDDGCMYCLDSRTGERLWRFQAAPDSRQVIGNRRLISAWPMRGGPVIYDDQLYFACGIWPFMGVYVYALNAHTGEVTWVNDDTGTRYMKQVKHTPAFGSIAPQGALVATESTLLVPGGRTVPAAFDRLTGEMRYYGIEAAAKGIGGAFVAGDDQNWFVHTRVKGTQEHEMSSGEPTNFSVNEPVLTDEIAYSAQIKGGVAVVQAYSRSTKELLWEIPADGSGDLILAGSTLYAAGKTSSIDEKSMGSLTAIRLPAAETPAELLWTIPTHVALERLAAAGGQLFGASAEGHILAFGDMTKITQAETIQGDKVPSDIRPELLARAERLLTTGDSQGYAYWLGLDDPDLVSAMSVVSPFVELNVADPDSKQVSEFRHRLDLSGVYGRVTVRETSWKDFRPPVYVANMIFVSEETTRDLSAQSQLLSKLYETVRPYGGTMHLLAKPSERNQLLSTIASLNFEKAEVSVSDDGVVVKKVGALPGAGTWTHKYGDIANSVKSNDTLVKLPLGVLWFGGTNHEEVLPRHGHGPPEQVVGGRLFIEGPNLLTARDVYTGRTLWQRTFEAFGTKDVFQDETYAYTPLDTAYNQVHIPGSNARGTNYVVADDRVYLVELDKCHVLDAATGEIIKSIALPQDDPKSVKEWGFLGIYEDVLIGGAGFANYQETHSIPTNPIDPSLSANRRGFGLHSLDRAASLGLIGFDRETGEQLWKVDARHSFWHNGVVAGNGLIFALDKNPQPIEERLKRRGISSPDTYRIVAFDARTGKIAWESSDRVFGTWLGYSEEFDMLLQAGAAASDRLTSEVGQGLAVHQGTTGATIWRKDNLKYSGPCVLYHDLIITNADQYSESAGAYYLTSGAQKMVINPLTGELVPWKITRAKGCNTMVASENLLTYRSETAAFFDLLSDSGTGYFGGFRSGCTTNLIVADGVLNAPDYTRTCSCGYQNQTSLALVHMPDVDAWSVTNTAEFEPTDGMLKRLGANFGAPGHRRDPQGLLWMELPSQTGTAANLELETNDDAVWYSDLSMAMTDSELPWVFSSGVEGVSRLRLGLNAKSKVRLENGVPIGRSADDVLESEDQKVSLNGSSIILGGSPVQQLAGLRFSNVPVARDAEIRSATIQFTSRSASDEPTALSIRAVAEGNAAAFKDQVKNVSSRQLTDSEVLWTPEPWKAGESGPSQQTPDLAPLVREIVSRPDWQAGNAIAFVISGNGLRTATAYLGPDSTATRLLIDAEETLPATVEAGPVPYRVRLYFGCPPSIDQSARVFDVSLSGQTILKGVTVDAEHSSVIHTIDRIELMDAIELEFNAHTGQPLISGLELERLE